MCYMTEAGLGVILSITAGSKADQICRLQYADYNMPTTGRLRRGNSLDFYPASLTVQRKKNFIIHNKCRHYLRHYLRTHHTINRLEERRVERGSARPSSLGNVGETSERRGGVHMGFSERINTILN